MKNFLVLLAILILQSCSSDPNIVITKDGVTNRFWGEYNNAIHVEKMKVKKDSMLDIMNPGFNKSTANHWNIIRKLEVDSTFYFGYSGLNVKKNKVKMKNKVSFTQYNGFDWYSNSGDKSIIGELVNDSWYKFSGLRTTPYFIYIYVDGKGDIHRFNVDMSNY